MRATTQMVAVYKNVICAHESVAKNRSSPFESFFAVWSRPHPKVGRLQQAEERLRWKDTFAGGEPLIFRKAKTVNGRWPHLTTGTDEARPIGERETVTHF